MKLAVFLTSVVYVISVPYAAFAREIPIHCEHRHICRYENGDVFKCLEKFVECCETADGTLMLRDSPRGKACCHGSGEVYDVRSQSCVNGTILDSIELKVCGNTYYNTSHEECCLSNEGFGVAHEKYTETQRVCCGSDYVDDLTGCCGGIKYDQKEKCCHNDKIEDISSVACLSQKEIEIPCSRVADINCCGGERIPDHSRYLCYRGTIKRKSKYDHNDICEFIIPQDNPHGRRSEASFNNRVEVCHQEIGPTALPEGRELCGELKIYSPLHDLCCAGELYRGRSHTNGWHCCPMSTSIYKKDDPSSCPEIPTAPTPHVETTKVRGITQEAMKRRFSALLKKGAYMFVFTVSKRKPFPPNHYKVNGGMQIVGSKRNKMKAEKSKELKVIVLPRHSSPKVLEVGERYYVVTKSKLTNKKLRLEIGKYAILSSKKTDTFYDVFAV